MKIGIAIVDYGKKEYLENCLKSLESFPYPADIFDCNENNIGFSRANNSLIRIMTGPNAGLLPNWIWLLNNDTTVPKETLSSIEKILSELPSDVGIVGFQIRSMDNPDLIHHAGTHQCYPGGVHKSGSVQLGQFKERTYEKWVTFASVLIRREVFEDIGLLDPNMFNYFSDSDFCFRARSFGWKIIYEPSFVIYHKIGQSQNPSPEQMKQIQSDGMVFESKWLNGKLYFDLDKEVF